MPIDIDNETLIRFADAAREFPGKPVFIQTLHRWILRGVRGTKLETVEWHCRLQRKGLRPACRVAGYM